jgi:hypothetical protein
VIWIEAVLGLLMAVSLYNIGRTLLRLRTTGNRKQWIDMQAESIRRELSERTQEAGATERREKAYQRLWLTLSPALAERQPPKRLNPLVKEHVELAMHVVGDYDTTLQNPGEFADSLYRPSSDLPYPTDAIRQSCEMLIGLADGTYPSLHHDRDTLAAEREVLGSALFFLDYFLDVDASNIPRERIQNLAVANKKYRTKLEARPHPMPGDVVVGGIEENSCVSQVIGVDSDGQWLVSGATGVPLQIVYNQRSQQWNQVRILTPAVNPKLRLST